MWSRFHVRKQRANTQLLPLFRRFLFCPRGVRLLSESVHHCQKVTSSRWISTAGESRSKLSRHGQSMRKPLRSECRLRPGSARKQREHGCNLGAVRFFIDCGGERREYKAADFYGLVKNGSEIRRWIAGRPSSRRVIRPERCLLGGARRPAWSASDVQNQCCPVGTYNHYSWFCVCRFVLVILWCSSISVFF